MYGDTRERKDEPGEAYLPSGMAARMPVYPEVRAGVRFSAEEIIRRILRNPQRTFHARGMTWTEEEVKALAERV